MVLNIVSEVNKTVKLYAAANWPSQYVHTHLQWLKDTRINTACANKDVKTELGIKALSDAASSA